MFGKDGMNKVYNYSVESELRNAGISSVFSRTLFVEAESDKDIFLPILSLHRINVVPVSDCREVIEHFKKIADIKNLIHGASFCFAMDRDNKSEQEILGIKQYSPEFFDESYIILERHEIENYFIDQQLVLDVLNPTLEILHENLITLADLDIIFHHEAEYLKEQSYLKFASSHLKQYIKEHIDLDPDASKSAAVENSKEVVKICTVYAQKGMFNIFIAIFSFALAFAFLSSPVGGVEAVGFFVSYLLSIAFFGLYQAIFMANAGGCWDNAKKVVEVDLKEKGSALHDATVVGDTVGDPFKDTSSVALNPIIKFTTLFGLLAVEMAVAAPRPVSLGLAIFFLVVGLVFVYRSFYRMKI